MCCRNGPRRQPLAITLYKMYQQRKSDLREQQQQLSSTTVEPRGRRASPPPHELERSANAEILEKAGLSPSPSPPSYDAAVSSVDASEGYRWEKVYRRNSSVYSRSDESDSELEGGAVEAAAADFVGAWRASRGVKAEGQVEREGEVVLSRWQQKRAERAGRKAERAARRADRAVLGL